MNWLVRLKNCETPRTDATEPTKPGFVAFVASDPRLPGKDTGTVSATNSPAANDAPLPARVRQRFRACCTRLGIEPEPILRQFDYWKYTARDLQDMDAWPDEIIETHTRLLYAEVKDGLP